MKTTHQSAPSPTRIKTLQAKSQLSIKCPTIFPAFLSNAFQKTSPPKTSPPSNALSTTWTPQNPAHTASSDSATSLACPTYQYIAGIVNSPTAPFITATSPCRISLAMTPQNPPAPLSTGDPLPLLLSIHLLKSSPQHSQGSLPHVLASLDSLLPLPLLQYPSDPQLPPTTSLPSDKCPLDQSMPPSLAMTSCPTPTEPSSTGWSSLPKHGPTTSPKTWLPKKWSSKRSWMTVTKPSSSWRPTSSGISKPSPNLLTGTLRTVTL